MKWLRVMTVASLVSCAVAADSGVSIQGLTQEQLDQRAWLYSSELDGPLDADQLVGPTDGLQSVRLVRVGNAVVACLRDEPGKVATVYHDGEIRPDEPDEGERFEPRNAGDLVTPANGPRDMGPDDGLVAPDVCKDRFWDLAHEPLPPVFPPTCA